MFVTRNADYDPSQLAVCYEPEQLHGHFVVTRGPSVAPDSWQRSEISGWVLRCERSLPCLDLVDPGGAPIGWLLGHPIDVKRRAVVTETCQVPAAKEMPGFERRFEDWLYALGGRFVAIVAEPRPRAYVDAFASLPIFFEHGARRVSSSPFLLVDPGCVVPDSALVEIVDPYRTGKWYPFEEMCHRDASRLLASHVLDMEGFVQRRIWPEGPFPAIALEDAVEITASIVEATIEAVACAGPVVLGLTAGGDSRMMLACTRELEDEIGLYTVAFDDVTGRADVATASRMARQLGLDWRRIPWVDGSEEDMRLWFYRTGAVTGEVRGRRSVRTENQLAGDEKPIRVAGVGVELARGRNWNLGLKQGELPDTPTKVLSGENLLARITQTAQPVMVEAADRWLEELPDLDALDTIDVCCLETYGGWFGPVTLGHPDAFVTTIFPFAHRTILGAVFGLPHEDRSTDRLRRDLVARCWPELGAFPVNRVPLRTRVRAKALRARQLPGGAVRRVRRRFRPSS